MCHHRKLFKGIFWHRTAPPLMPPAMGYLWLLRGTAQQLLLRTVFHAWLYAQRLAVEARIALQIQAPRRRRRFDVFRYRYLLFAFKFWWRCCIYLRAAQHGVDLRTILAEPEGEPRPSQQFAFHCYIAPPFVFDGHIWYRLEPALPYPSIRALRCLSRAHAARIRTAQARTATHVINGRMALVWEFVFGMFVQLAPPLCFDPLTCIDPHCTVEFLS